MNERILIVEDEAITALDLVQSRRFRLRSN